MGNFGNLFSTTRLCVLVTLFWCIVIHAKAALIFFSCEPVAVGFIKGNKITAYVEGAEVGSLSYGKVPVCPWFIVYDFYIKPLYRNRGYGKELLKKILCEIIATGARKIFVQPGPFELVNGNAVLLSGNEKRERIMKLVHLYESFQFRLIDSTCMEYILNALYIMMGIDEDPHFLMVLNVPDKYSENIGSKL